jgi:hypothetical protein
MMNEEQWLSQEVKADDRQDIAVLHASNIYRQKNANALHVTLGISLQ